MAKPLQLDHLPRVRAFEILQIVGAAFLTKRFVL